MYHGENAIKDAEELNKPVANGGIPENIEEYEITSKQIAQGLLLIDLLLLSGLVSSKSEGKRMIEQNGISINNIKIVDVNKKITEEDISMGFFVIQKGKKLFKKIVKKI